MLFMNQISLTLKLLGVGTGSFEDRHLIIASYIFTEYLCPKINISIAWLTSSFFHLPHNSPSGSRTRIDPLYESVSCVPDCSS